MNAIKEIVQPILMFLLAVGGLMLALFLAVLMSALFWNGVQWAWNL